MLSAVIELRKFNVGLLDQQEAEGGHIDRLEPKSFDTEKGLYKKDKPPEYLPYLPEEDNRTTGEKVSAWAEKANSFINEYANPVMNMLMQIDQVMAERENAQLQRDEFNNNQKKKNLKRQLDAKIISQKQYDDGVAKIDNEMDEKKRAVQVKAAKRQKAISLMQAIVNTALSVTSALSMSPFIVGLIMAVLAAALGAVQIATIAKSGVPEAFMGRYRAWQKARQAAMGRYDVLGQEVATLVDDDVVAGMHMTQWKPEGLASGMYLYRLQVRPSDSIPGRDFGDGAEGTALTRKIVLIR